jgi:tetratricopeptide (TPR) repeat protein
MGNPNDHPDAEELFQAAVQAAQAREPDTARRLLAQLVAAHPNHEQGWLMLATLLSDVARAVECLERVLLLNPDNARAREWLARAQGEKLRQAAVAEVAAEPAQPDIPLKEPGDDDRPVPRVGQYLLEFKFITADQLRAALLAQRQARASGQTRRLGDILLEQGAITAERLNFALREQHRGFYSLFND